MYSLITLSLALGASALVVPRSSCSFELTAAGGQTGTIGQLSDGQNRIGGGLSPTTFTLNNGSITDAAGRGCILTSSIGQFQCDQSVSPASGFSIESNGTLEHSGSSTFYACAASDTEWNLYTTPVVGQDTCVEISLTASGCGATTSTSAAPSVITVSSVATVTVHDCALPSSTARLASSAPVVVPTSVATFQSTAPAVVSSIPAISVATVQSPTPIVKSSSVVVPAVSSAPANTIVPVGYTSAIASSEVSTQTVQTLPPVKESSAVVQSSAPAVKPTTVVSVVQSSSIIVQTTVPLKSTETVVPVEKTSSVLVSSQVPSTAATYSSISSVPINTPIPSTLITVIPTTTPTSSLIWVNTTSTLASLSVPPSSLNKTSTIASTTILPSPVLTTTSIITSIPIPASSTPCTTSILTSASIAPSSSIHWANTTSSLAPTSLSPSSSSSSTPSTSATTSSSSCAATSLTGSSTTGNYQYPHLILPLSPNTPTAAPGTSYFGTISSNTSSIFSFDIPSTWASTTCNLIFLLPLQSQLETSSYTYSGTSNTISFSQLARSGSSSGLTTETTWASAPGVAAELGSLDVREGSSTLVESFACGEFAGGSVAFEMKAVGDLYLEFFEDWNPSPLGLYVTHC